MSARRVILLLLITVLGGATYAVRENGAGSSSASKVITKNSSAEPQVEQELQVVIDEPEEAERVWFFTQYEFDMLRQEQKSEFAEAISKSFAKKNRVLTGLDELNTKESALDAFSNKDKWAKIENKINSACKRSANYLACEEVSDLRINVLMNYRARK